MSLYLIVSMFLVGGAVFEFVKKQTPKIFYYISFAALTVMLCLRYGQGTDYISYADIYAAIPANFFEIFSSKTVHSEFGWKILCWLFRTVNTPFPAFVAILSLVEMAMLFLFVNEFCKNKVLALTLGYHTLYLTYFFSIMRQGLVIALFIGIMLDWIIQKKYIRYVILSLLCATIHTASLLLLIVPIVNTKFLAKLKWQLILVGVAWGFGVLISSGALDAVLPVILPSRIYMYLTTRKESISLFAVIERILSFGVIFFSYWYCIKTGEENAEAYTTLIRIATIGMIIYGGFIWQPMIASRLSYVFKVVEIGIFCGLLLNHRMFSKLKITYLLCLVLIMLVKNIDSYIYQGLYFESINVFNYPYISIFDMGNIVKYRSIK